MLFKVISLDCARLFEIVNHYSKRNDEKELEVNTVLSQKCKWARLTEDYFIFALHNRQAAAGSMDKFNLRLTFFT